MKRGSSRSAAAPKRPRSTPASRLPATRRSWQATKLGSIAGLEEVESAVPAPGEGEVVVGVTAIGLNYADVFCVLGLYEAANKHLKEAGDGALCPGLEFAGEVLAVGPQVSTLAPGDRVFGFTRFGAYRTAVVQSEQLLRKLPEGWTDAEGAALLVQGLTAWHGMVELGGAREGSRVLVHAAAGGTGCAALQICASLGCDAVGVVSSEAKAAFLRERFPRCEPLVRSAEPKAYSAQLAARPAFDVVVESLGGGFFHAGLDAVAPGGRLVTFGFSQQYGGSSVDGIWKWLKLVPAYLRRPMVDPGKLVPKNRSVMGFNLIWLTERRDMLVAELDAMCGRGGLQARPPAIGREYDWAELPAALAYLRSGAHTGKVVVTVQRP